METKNKEQEFIKKVVTLAKDRNLAATHLIEILDELKIGEKE